MTYGTVDCTNIRLIHSRWALMRPWWIGDHHIGKRICQAKLDSFQDYEIILNNISNVCNSPVHGHNGWLAVKTWHWWNCYQFLSHLASLCKFGMRECWTQLSQGYDCNEAMKWHALSRCALNLSRSSTDNFTPKWTHFRLSSKDNMYHSSFGHKSSILSRPIFSEKLYAVMLDVSSFGQKNGVLSEIELAM